jgi:hypothetical protein
VTVGDEELRAVGPDLLVLVEWRFDPVLAFRVPALANELRRLGAEELGGLSDAFIGIPERRLCSGDSRLRLDSSCLPH